MQIGNNKSGRKIIWPRMYIRMEFIISFDISFFLFLPRLQRPDTYRWHRDSLYAWVSFRMPIKRTVLPIAKRIYINC